jgi:centromere protein I
MACHTHHSPASPSLELLQRFPGDPGLVALLRVYKDYYPEIILGEAVRGRASAFRYPDPAWRERLAEIRDAHAEKTQAAPDVVRNGFRAARGADVGRKRASAVPLVKTMYATEVRRTRQDSVVPRPDVWTPDR